MKSMPMWQRKISDRSRLSLGTRTIGGKTPETGRISPVFTRSERASAYPSMFFSCITCRPASYGMSCLQAFVSICTDVICIHIKQYKKENTDLYVTFVSSKGAVVIIKILIYFVHYTTTLQTSHRQYDYVVLICFEPYWSLGSEE